MKPYLWLPVIILLSACHHDKKKSDDAYSEAFDALHKVKYSKFLQIEIVDDQTFMYVKNPWKTGDILASYHLSRDRNHISTVETDFQIQVPADKIISLSSTYLGMFCLLDEREKLTAVTDARLICDSVLYSRFLDGSLADLGDYLHINAEAVVGQKPGMVMKYIFAAPDETDRQIIQAGIPVAYNLEYMEPHPLGRAEWIKFVAAFIGKEKMADSIFLEIENEYLKWSARAGNKDQKPTVMDGSCYKGIWHAAGGKSYPARLYKDAGAMYYWEDDTSHGNIPLSLEVVIQNQINSDFWMSASSGSREKLLEIESRYKVFKAFHEDHVYHFGKNKNPNGGYDYYESGVVRPDILLKDLISIFHPDLMEENYETIYLQKIQ